MRKNVFWRVLCAGLVIVLMTGLSLPVLAGGEAEEYQPESVTARVPILMYHAVTKDRARHGKFAISPQELEKDLRFLQDQGYTTLVIQDLLDFVNQGSPLPDKPVLLTFDDGNYGDYLYVWPLLQEYHMRAVISIIGKPTEEHSREGRTDIHYPQLTWEQIKDMLDSGAVEIQNHSYNMHGATGAMKRKKESKEAFENRFTKDIEKLQSLMREHLEITPTAFTFPLGGISDGAGECLRQMGFCASLTCREGINIIQWGKPDSLFRLKRVNRPHGVPAAEILKKFS